MKIDMCVQLRLDRNGKHEGVGAGAGEVGDQQKFYKGPTKRKTWWFD
jgi:hypothetical protein